ncbi:hypothetical protein L1887_15317 [Cichorium endivia]|nr:hypothetical protein L1887_15317 [Cichorium endivia]
MLSFTNLRRQGNNTAVARGRTLDLSSNPHLLRTPLNNQSRIYKEKNIFALKDMFETKATWSQYVDIHDDFIRQANQLRVVDGLWYCKSTGT